MKGPRSWRDRSERDHLVVRPRGLTIMARASARSALPRTSHLQLYLRDVNETPLLSAEEERALAERVAAGDPEARDHMVRANLRLVVNIARSYLGKGLGLEDLIEEG